MEWWTELHILQNVMFIVGCALSAVLLVQIIMMLIGMGNDTTFDSGDDFDTQSGGPDDFNNDGPAAFGMRLLSIRSIVAFLGVAAWTVYGVMFGLPYWWAAVLIALPAGFGAACLMTWAITAVQKLQSQGNVQIKNAVGQTAQVYLRIPESRKGLGKVQLTVQERTREYDAMTDAPELIKTGAKVKVTEVISEGTLLVEPIGPLITDNPQTDN